MFQQTTPQPQQSFIFGGNTGRTYEDIQRMRANANALKPTGGSRNVAEGVSALGKALIGRLIERDADRAEKQGRQKYNNVFQEILSQPRGQWDMGKVAELSQSGYGSEAQRGAMATLVQQDLERRLGVSGGPAQMSALDRARLEGQNLTNQLRARQLAAGQEPSYGDPQEGHVWLYNDDGTHRMNDTNGSIQ